MKAPKKLLVQQLSSSGGGGGGGISVLIKAAAVAAEAGGVGAEGAAAEREGREGGGCWCRRLDDNLMTCCDHCDIWHHLNCIKDRMGVEATKAASDGGNKKWYCNDCELKKLG